jgi:hypothetical protein
MSIDVQKDLNDKEINELLKRIGKPILKFMIKVIEKEMLSGYYKDMSLSCFATIIIVLLANNNRNMIDWLAAFWSNRTGNDAPYDAMKKHLLNQLDEYFKVKVGKN